MNCGLAQYKKNDLWLRLSSATTTRMILVLFILAFFYFLLISKCHVSASAVSKLDEKDIKLIKQRFRENTIEFRTFFNHNPKLRAAIVEIGLDEIYKDDKKEFMVCRFEYSVRGVIDEGYREAMAVYMKSAYDFNFNYYFENLWFDATVVTWDLYGNMESNRLDHHEMTPLQLAVARNRLDIVKDMVEATFSRKLKLDMPHKSMPLVNARSIARKIYNPNARIKMLNALKIDKTKHDLTIVKRHLQEELNINVKEAVIYNSVEMVESALFLGNYGDKTDTNIIRYAMKNGNYLILEMLVMEGYAIPAEKDRPNFENMNRDDVNLILSVDDINLRHPLPYRYINFLSISPQNKHCI